MCVRIKESKGACLILQSLPVIRILVEKISADHYFPSLCLCTVSKKSVNINTKSNGHVLILSL